MKPGHKASRKKGSVAPKAFPIVNEDSTRSSTKTALSPTVTEAGGRSRLSSTGRPGTRAAMLWPKRSSRPKISCRCGPKSLTTMPCVPPKIILAIDGAVQKTAEAVKTAAQAAQAVRDHARAEQVRRCRIERGRPHDAGHRDSALRDQRPNLAARTCLRQEEEIQ